MYVYVLLTAALMLLLFASGREDPPGGCSLFGRAGQVPRAHAVPLTLLCDDAQFKQASTVATWPDELRRRPSSRGERLCVLVAPGVEFLAGWDARARAPHSSQPGLEGDVMSHPLRHGQRALARARRPVPLPSAARGGHLFACPDARLLVGREELVLLAQPLCPRRRGADDCLASFRVGLWLVESDLKLACFEEELAFVPVCDGEPLVLTPTLSETDAAAQEVGNESVVLPCLGACARSQLSAGPGA